MEFKIGNVKVLIAEAKEGFFFTLKRGRKTVESQYFYGRARDAKRGAMRAAKRQFGVA